MDKKKSFSKITNLYPTYKLGENIYNYINKNTQNSVEELRPIQNII